MLRPANLGVLRRCKQCAALLLVRLQAINTLLLPISDWDITISHWHLGNWVVSRVLGGRSSLGLWEYVGSML